MSVRHADRAVASDLECPWCHATPGRPCRLPGGRLTDTHAARRREAKGMPLRATSVGPRAQAQLKGGPLSYRVRSKSSRVSGGTDVEVIVVIGGRAISLDLFLPPGQCTERGLRAAVEKAVAGMGIAQEAGPAGATDVTRDHEVKKDSTPGIVTQEG